MFLPALEYLWRKELISFRINPNTPSTSTSSFVLLVVPLQSYAA